jgi:hypothetical protein
MTSSTSPIADRDAVTADARRSVWAWLAIGWTVLLLVACWLPADWMPVREPGGSPRRLPNADKLVHAALFGGFALLWRRAGWPAGRVVVVGLALAVATEAGQALPMIRRDADALDAAADALGVLAAVGVAGWFGGDRRGSG